MSAPNQPAAEANHAAISSANDTPTIAPHDTPVARPHDSPTPTVSPAADAQAEAPPELPPAYAVVDEKATRFSIYGTLLYTPNGPAYQLSSLLDARIARLRIRRLRAAEVAFLQGGGAHLAFDEGTTLYEAHDPPFALNEYYLVGKHSGCLQGVLQLRFGVRRWHVRHAAVQGGRAEEILVCGKPGGWGRALRERRNEMVPSEWRDAGGSVLATEVMRMEGGGKMPTIELREGLDQTCRELLLALWVVRLWAAFGAGMQGEYMA